MLVALISTVNETHITAAQFQERYAEVAGLETNVTSAGETARAILDVLNTSRTGELLIL